MSEENMQADRDPPSDPQPYQTPAELPGENPIWWSTKRIWISLIALLFFAGGAFAIFATRTVQEFGGSGRGGYIQEVEHYGGDSRIGKDHYEEPRESPAE